jgi:apolipoprotein N-acyltransferase
MKGPNRLSHAGAQLEELQRLSEQLQGQGAELIVWPETGYPYALPRDIAQDFPPSSPYRVRGDLHTPLVFGSVTRAPRTDGGRRRAQYNTMLLLDRDGRFAARYDKQFLLLFGEYTPGRDELPWLDRLMPATAGQFSRGRELRTLPLRGRYGRELRLGPMICYEDILRDFGLRLAPLHPHLLLNITNDSWFGDTTEPWEHLGLSVFRAVEMRTDLVRAVNTGVSAYVDATGRVTAKTYAVDPSIHPRGADTILRRVALLEGGHTVYAKIGDAFGELCGACTVWLWLVLPWRRRRELIPNRR